TGQPDEIPGMVIGDRTISADRLQRKEVRTPDADGHDCGHGGTSAPGQQLLRRRPQQEVKQRQSNCYDGQWQPAVVFGPPGQPGKNSGGDGPAEIKLTQ